MNRYKVAGPRPVFDVGSGDEFDRELTAEEEADLLSRGRIELVPREYRVLSHNFAEGEPGATFKGAYRVEIEKTLLDAGHIERVGDQEQEDLSKLKREELDERAAAYGLDPADYPNKEAVVEAIEAAKSGEEE